MRYYTREDQILIVALKTDAILRVISLLSLQLQISSKIQIIQNNNQKCLFHNN